MSAVVYFDRHVDDQRRAMATDGNWALCYERQVAVVESLFRPGMTVLDVGCGPRLPYDTTKPWVIGLDPSRESLDQNTDVDERLCASATEIPLPDASVDLVVAFYSLHHMTTETWLGNVIRADIAVNEMVRVVKPSGQVLIFEMQPQPWAEELQFRCWDFAKALLGDRLDACFLRGVPLFKTQTFDAPWWTLIAPILSLPWLKIPRGLWPLTPTLYRWTKEQTDA